MFKEGQKVVTFIAFAVLALTFIFSYVINFYCSFSGRTEYQTRLEAPTSERRQIKFERRPSQRYTPRPFNSLKAQLFEAKKLREREDQTILEDPKEETGTMGYNFFGWLHLNGSVEGTVS